MTWTVDQQLELSATQAVEAIQAGQLKAADYVATLLARAQALSNLNALTVLDVEGALATAQRIDSLGASERARLPLAGLPVVVKDNINTRGLQTSAGTPALEGFVPARHAPSVQRLVDAGAILLGKANMHELAFGITSTNLAPHAGPVPGNHGVEQRDIGNRAPHRPDRIARMADRHDGLRVVIAALR
ncbi:amidase family protein, partial [Paraburkholderia sp. BR10872]|uniref:amidase family protein n=1 Tax=Paraburkholderia sp. BR10872 TaxID=3236989 RepID=UPI0034D37230